MIRKIKRWFTYMGKGKARAPLFIEEVTCEWKPARKSYNMSGR